MPVTLHSNGVIQYFFYFAHSFILSCLFLLVIGLGMFFAPFLAAKHYHHTGIDREQYKGAEHYEILLEQAIDRCIDKKKRGDEYGCDESFGLIKKFNSISDLEAQITVARATKGIPVVGAMQAAASILTFFLLVLTVFQTRGILTEAKNTTTASKRALEHAQKTRVCHVTGSDMMRSKTSIWKIEKRHRDKDPEYLPYNWSEPPNIQPQE